MGTNKVGMRFGKLYVFEKVGMLNSNLMYMCTCDCGNVVIRPSSSLIDNKRVSCGCTWIISPEARLRHTERLRQKNQEILQKIREQELERELDCERKAQVQNRGGYGQTICWNCIRSAAPPSLQCVWDKTKGKQLPEGCKFITEDIHIGIKTVVIGCPEFLSLYDEANRKLLEEERQKNRKVMMDNIRNQVAVGVRRART